MSTPIGSAHNAQWNPPSYAKQTPKPGDPPAEHPPADPHAPGLKAEPGFAPGPNNFKIGIKGPDPQLAVGGTHDQQEQQRHELLSLAVRGMGSYATGHIPGLPRIPSDSQVEAKLANLQPNPPLGQAGDKVTQAIYQSHIPNATAEQAYRHFVEQPDKVFGAGNMEIRPPLDRLKDGARSMLETGGPPPTWLPIQVGLNDKNHSISIQTLDGHVLRGSQTFTFTDDGKGGAVLTQDAKFQASTKLVGDMQQLASVSQGQHSAWQMAHREIYEHFNGNQNFQGMGTSAVSPHLLKGWADLVSNAVKNPGTTADVGLSSAGEIGNEATDDAGKWVGDFLDKHHLGGGDTVRHVSDDLGDKLSNSASNWGAQMKKIIGGLG